MNATTYVKKHRIRLDVVYGAESGDDAWKQQAHGYTCTLKKGRRRFTFPYWMGIALTDEPTAEIVLEGLSLDAASGGQTFEDFCAEFGLDTDSRKAEATWRECGTIRLRLEALLGSEAYEELSSVEW